MSESASHVKSGHPVVALARDGSRFTALELRMQHDKMEVLWHKTSEAAGDWQAFAAECGLVTEQAESTRAARKKHVVLGFGATGVAFYRLEAPMVGKEEMASVVQMQAESLLPLPGEMTETAWRSRPGPGKTAVITLAAAKRDNLIKFMERTRPVGPKAILLNAEAVVKAWKVLFGGAENRAAVVSLGCNSGQLCLVQDGQLTHAAVLDVGVDDLVGESSAVSEFTGGGLLHQTEMTERFVRDVRSALESFGVNEDDKLPVLVLSDGASELSMVASTLEEIGMNARTILPLGEQISGPEGFGPKQVYEYRVALGLALMELETPADWLDLFDRLRRPEKGKKKSLVASSPVIAAALAVVMLIALIVTAYAVDKATAKALTEIESQAGFEEVRKQYETRRTVAQNRPDLLELLNEISSGDTKGILLD